MSCIPVPPLRISVVGWGWRWRILWIRARIKERITWNCLQSRPWEELDEAKEMGRGCNGAVYEVRLHGLPCIAKRLHDILVGRGREEPVSREQRSVVIGRFREECVLLSGLRHGLAYTSTPSPSYIVTSMLATCCSLSLSEQRLLTSG